MKSYAEAGVDIEKEERAVKSLLKSLEYKRKDFGKPVLVNHFASVIDIGVKLAITTDGVGTKIKVAEIMNDFTTIGIDCVAMNVNDLMAVGAEPIAIVDYIATNNPDERIMAEIGKGLNEGCKIANINLIGGETATLDFVKGWDLSATAIGIVKELITGDKIREGDVIIAFPSSGIHSNGLTLARKLIERNGISYFDKFDGKRIGEVLLTPTRIYTEILEIIERYGDKIHGMAHITGGGLLNLKRLKIIRFVIENPLKPHKIFNFIQELGEIDDREMYRTFNMGMGFMLIVDEEIAKEVEKCYDARIVGYVEEGSGVYLKGIRID